MPQALPIIAGVAGAAASLGGTLYSASQQQKAAKNQKRSLQMQQKRPS